MSTIMHCNAVQIFYFGGPWNDGSVEHRAVTREVVSSTPAEPTVRVLK